MDDVTRTTYTTRMTMLSRVQDQYDDASWREFIESYRRYIDAIICRMGVQSADQGDVMQEVLVKLWKAIPDLDLGRLGRFRSFLVTVTRNCVYDFVRKEAGRRGTRKERFKQYQEGLEQMTQPEIEQVADEEWNKYVYTTALERVSRETLGEGDPGFYREHHGGRVRTAVLYDWGMAQVMVDKAGAADQDMFSPDELNSWGTMGYVRGTPGFMAPEQIDQHGVETAATDV